MPWAARTLSPTRSEPDPMSTCLAHHVVGAPSRVPRQKLLPFPIDARCQHPRRPPELTGAATNRAFAASSAGLWPSWWSSQVRRALDRRSSVSYRATQPLSGGPAPETRRPICGAWRLRIRRPSMTELIPSWHKKSQTTSVEEPQASDKSSLTFRHLTKGEWAMAVVMICFLLKIPSEAKLERI